MTSLVNSYQLCDAFDLLARLPDASVDLIATDPPYFGIVAEGWDNQWDTLADFSAWVERLAVEFRRVLKPHGALYWFADDKRAAYCQLALDRHFRLVNSLVWDKPATQSCIGIENNLRSYAIHTERILFYEQTGASALTATGLEVIHSLPECFTSIKAYMRAERDKVKTANGWKTQKEFDAWCCQVTGTSSMVARHCFCDSQFALPTPEQYRALQSSGFFSRPYDALRAEYDALRAEHDALRRPWNNDPRAREILSFSLDSGTFHPTQKPLALMRYLLARSTRPGFVVLDPFGGSATTAAAAISLGLDFISCERDPRYHAAALARLDAQRLLPRIPHPCEALRPPSPTQIFLPL